MKQSKKTEASKIRSEKLLEVFEFAYKMPSTGWPELQYEHGMEICAAIIFDTCKGFTRAEAVSIIGRNVSGACAVGIVNRGRYRIAFPVNKVGLTAIANEFGVDLMLSQVKLPGSVGLMYTVKGLEAAKGRLRKERDAARRLKIENINKLKKLRDERRKG